MAKRCLLIQIYDPEPEDQQQQPADGSATSVSQEPAGQGGSGSQQSLEGEIDELSASWELSGQTSVAEPESYESTLSENE